MWIKKNECCGCGACSNACPCSCISMDSDEEGFRYPVIDKSKCINCKLCEKVCPVLNIVESDAKVSVYACRNIDDDIVKNSSSGGLFTALATEIINRHGVVFGVLVDEKCTVVHDYTETIEGLKRFRGSKYVQSDMGDTYKKVKMFLDNDRYVLFSGTSCQTAGLKSYLRKDYNKLYCIDVICHGVPSPLVLEKYISLMKNTYNQEIHHVSFRDKTEGWAKYSLLLKFDNATYREDLLKDAYLRGFVASLYLRPSCYACKYKNFKAGSDISIADFWGINSITNKFGMNSDGVSMVCVNSLKGDELFASIEEGVDTIQVDILDAIKCNSAIVQSPKKNSRRKRFFKNINKVSIDKNIEQCMRVTLKNRICIAIMRLLKRRRYS